MKKIQFLFFIVFLAAGFFADISLVSAYAVDSLTLPVTGNIIVGTAPLTVTATNVNKTYGATLAGGSGSIAFSSSGLQNGESIGSVTIAYGTGSAANAAVALPPSQLGLHGKYSRSV